MIDFSANDPSSPAFFEAMYQAKSDPWNFSTDAYELGRYDAIVSSLSTRRYRHAFEPGCSIGVLTERLAACCDAVSAIDFSESAALQAISRCAHFANVDVRCASITTADVGSFDLLILSEIGYYFSPEDWTAIASRLIDRLPCGGVVVAAHWLGRSKDHCTSGDEVHEVLLAHPYLQLEFSSRGEHMRLDRLVRR